MAVDIQALLDSPQPCDDCGAVPERFDLASIDDEPGDEPGMYVWPDGYWYWCCACTWAWESDGPLPTVRSALEATGAGRAVLIALGEAL